MALSPPHSNRGPRLRRFSPASLVGRVLAGKYVATDVIGEGGMGCVLEAHCIETGRPVAVKVLTAAAFNPLNLRRFRRECKATAELRHPNLCEVFDHGTLARGAPYIAMERLRGETLSARLRASGPLDVGDAVSLSLQLLAALSVAHEAGVLHRDVKPGNLFLTSARGKLPTAKLIDFGLAKVLPTCSLETFHDDTVTITQSDLIIGTPSYLSPEQVRADVSVDERIDVWAAGLTMYEMLSGAKAFRASTQEGLMVRILRDEIPPIRELRPDVPIELASVIHDAIAKNRDVRSRTAGDLRRSLLMAWSKHRANGLAIFPPSTSPPPPSTKKMTPRAFRDALPTLPRDVDWDGSPLPVAMGRTPQKT